MAMDEYDDHLEDEDEGTADELVKFVFFANQTEKRETVRIADDQCITPERTLRIAI